MIEQQARRRVKTKVPYVPWSQMKLFLDRIRILNPKVIDAEYLRANQMSGQQPSPLLNAIQYLGLTDDTGVPTAKLDSLKVKGADQYREALAKIVREAYSDLFSAVSVEAADRDLLYNQITTVYGCSPRIANSATPLFISLCQEAGIEVLASQVVQPKNVGYKPARVSVKERPARRDSPTSSGAESSPTQAGGEQVVSEQPRWPSLHIDIQIHIDSSASADQIDQVFASMARHLGKPLAD